jgi:hypothetical protein
MTTHAIMHTMRDTTMHTIRDAMMHAIRDMTAMVHVMRDAMATTMVHTMRDVIVMAMMHTIRNVMVMVTVHTMRGTTVMAHVTRNTMAMMHLLIYSTCTLYTIILLNVIYFSNQLLIA